MLQIYQNVPTCNCSYLSSAIGKVTRKIKVRNFPLDPTNKGKISSPYFNFAILKISIFFDNLPRCCTVADCFIIMGISIGEVEKLKSIEKLFLW